MASDPALADLEKQLREVNRRLADTQREARAAADGVGEVGEKARLTLGGVRDASEALTGLRLSLAGASQALVDWAMQVPEGAARAERHQQALLSLGGAYDAVASATQGAVSAEQAAAVQQRAAQAGLRLTAQELAAVAQRARDYARATGTELGQALDQLTDQLVDPGEELRKFGIFLQTGMQAGDAMRETLRQITAQAEATTPAVQSLAESQEAFHRATQEVSDALSAQVAQTIGLRDLYQNLTTWFTDAAQSGRALDVILEGIVGTMTEMVGLRSSIDVQRGQSAHNAFTSAVGEQLQRIRGAGVNLSGFGMEQLSSSLNEQERSRVVALLQTRAQRATQMRGAGGIPAALQGGGVLFAADSRGFEFDEIERIVKAANERATAAARSASAGRQAEINRRNRAGSSGGGGGARRVVTRDGTEIVLPVTEIVSSATLEMDRAITDAEAQQRSAVAFRALSREGLSERMHGIEGAASSAEALRALGLARGGSEGVASQQRVTILREQAEALRVLLADTMSMEAAQREGGATARELNDLLSQRVGIQTALAQATRDLTEELEAQNAPMRAFGDAMIGHLEGVADAFGEAVVAALEGSKGFAQSMEDMLRATMRTLAKEGIVNALKETALGLAGIASGNPLAIGHFKAAAVWGAVGIAAGAATAAMAPTTAPSSAGARDTGARTDRGARADRETGGPLVLNINVSGAAFTDAGVHQAVAGSLREAIGSGYLTRTDLAGVLGG